MKKRKHSNLPENVLPQGQFFDANSNASSTSIVSSWHPLQNEIRIDVGYMSPKEKKHQEKLMRQTRKGNRHEQHRNQKNNRSRRAEKFAPYDKYAEFQEETHKSRTNTLLEPRTDRQREYLAMLDNMNTHMVFGVGPAGSGKTYMATKWAALALQEGIFDKIVITRPTVSVSENIGFLPGTLEEKMDPWILPVKDVLEEVFGKSKVESFFNLGKISIEPLGFMRGRTFNNAVILLDEAQNCTPDQLKMFLTRIGEGSKMVITGDIKQSDYNNGKNGLLDFLTRIKKIEGIDMIKFDRNDIQRHHLISEILKLYGEED